MKCLIWDLDHTLWDGILLEGDVPQLRPGVKALIETLDQRGILQSIASKNDPAAAMARLETLGLSHYFLYPQIGWGTKSSAVERIAKTLNIGIDAMAFIDDQPFERDEVAFQHPQVLCLDDTQIEAIAGMPAFMPRFITDESAARRQMYLHDARRKEIEDCFEGPQEDFLASLDMVFTVKHAETGDLQRLEELTARTNQLNTTGRIYSTEELDAFRRSTDHVLLVASLDDKYGAYGKIGLALIHTTPTAWTVKLLLMSCRVMSRGVGSVLLGHIMRAAQAHGVSLRSEMILNDRNRLMYATYRFAGFKVAERQGAMELLEADAASAPKLPPYLRFSCDNEDIVERAATT